MGNREGWKLSKTWLTTSFFGSLIVAFAAGAIVSPGDQPAKRAIINIQVNGIIEKARAVYAMKQDFGHESIVPVITAGQDHPFPCFWIPPKGYSWDDRWETNGDLIRRAVEGMAVSRDGEELHSEFLGEVTVRAKGPLLEISFPDCPKKLCTETSVAVSIR